MRFYGLGWRSFRADSWNIFDVLVASGSLITSTLFVSASVQDTVYAPLLMNTIFFSPDTSICRVSLPVILSVLKLSLWLVLFVFFSILFEVMPVFMTCGCALPTLQAFQDVGLIFIVTE